VALQGMLGSRALLLIDGGAPPQPSPWGDSAQGVKLVSVGADSAVVEIAGKRVALRLGESPGQPG
jgi:aspartyl protease family protein